VIGCVGTDDEGARLHDALAARGVDVTHLVATSRPTATLHRVVASQQLLLRFDTITDHRVDNATATRLATALREAWGSCEAVIVSDYGYGTVDALRDTIAELQRDDPRLLVLDAKHLGDIAPLQPTVVKPNWAEVAELLGLTDTHGRVEEVLAHGDRILELTGARIATVTLDLAGAVVFESGCEPYRLPVRSAPTRHAIGAGDTFVATLACALAAGMAAPSAAELAATAATVAVENRRTATCTAGALAAAVEIGGKVLRSLAELADVVTWYRAAGRRIVFTNGCFDILHRGHISYLERARMCGDVLIVGVNDDASVARLKGPLRPVNTVDDRVAVLAALRAVDHIVTFSEDMPEHLLHAICPDVYVKGDDYSLATLPEAPLVHKLGSRVEFIPLVEDRSTSRLIDRIVAGAER
jgi:D-beta-D-heptose 7-phosphate kinase / D-beta-D-heptose 1-phosphate adenosyltransferase